MTKRLATIVWIGLTAVAVVAACDDSTDEGDASTGGGGQGSSTGHGGGNGFVCPTSMSVADCPSMCQAVTAAACPGAPSQQQCEANCADLNAYVAMCPAWGAVVDCMGASPTFTCMEGESVPAGCEEEFYCMSLCFE